MMPDNTSQETVDDTASTVDALADILDDPLTDTVEDEADAEPDSEEASDDAADDDDGEEDSDEDGDDEEDDGSEDTQGRFVGDNARIRLSDGTLTTVGELKGGQLRQSDYTRKAQSLAEERTAFEAEQARVGQAAQQLQERISQADQWLEMTKPRRPEATPQDDPVAWLEYREQVDQWNDADRYWKAEREKAEGDQEADRVKSSQQVVQRETEALYSAVPALKDPGKREAFLQEVVKVGGEHYGLTEQDVRSISDHRVFLALKDALAYRRITNKAAKVKEQIDGKPKMVKGSRRTSPKVRNARDRAKKTERLRDEGTFSAGVAALMDHDL